MKVFVYGTLKRGELRHASIQGKFLGSAKAPGWVLRDLGAFPAATPGPGTIYGELYEVDSLATLDVVEGYPHLYNRVDTNVYVASKEHRAWIYFMEESDAPIIESGVWDA